MIAARIKWLHSRLPQPIRFLMAGGVAAMVNIVARYFYNFAVPFEVATILAYLTGMPVSYALMRRQVFAASGRHMTAEMVRFALVNLISFCTVTGVSVFLYRLALPAIGLDFHAADIAHVTGTCSGAVTSYIGHKYFSFAAKRKVAA